MDCLTGCKECDWLSGLPIISASGEILQGWKQKLVSGKIFMSSCSPLAWPQGGEKGVAWILAEGAPRTEG